MTRSGAITMIVLGIISLAVAGAFVFSTQPLEPSGRTNLPAIVIEIIAALAGVVCLIYGFRGLRNGSGSRP